MALVLGDVGGPEAMTMPLGSKIRLTGSGPGPQLRCAIHNLRHTQYGKEIPTDFCVVDRDMMRNEHKVWAVMILGTSRGSILAIRVPHPRSRVLFDAVHVVQDDFHQPVRVPGPSDLRTPYLQSFKLTRPRTVGREKLPQVLHPTTGKLFYRSRRSKYVR